MASVVEICNIALTRIGQETINALDEESTEAKKCNVIYDALRRETLRTHSWAFASKIRSLVKSATDTVPGWEYAYIYPKDCLYVQKVYSIAGNKELAEFRKIHSNVGTYLVLVTNVDSAVMEYTADVTDSTLFDSLFVSALAWNIAANLAQSLTADAQIIQQAANMYRYTIDQAKVSNKSEQHTKDQATPSYITARG
jgi:hypothetical protein